MDESQISLIASINFDYIYIEKAHRRIPNIHGKFEVEKLSLSFFCKVIPNDYLDHMVTLLKIKNRTTTFNDMSMNSLDWFEVL